MQDYYRDQTYMRVHPSAMVHRFGVNGKLAGNLAAIQEVANTATIMYGPKGCAYGYRTSARSRNTPFYDIVSVNFQDQDVIFGAEAKLRKTLLEVDKRQKPELIFILPTVVSDIINDDLEGIALDIQSQVQAKIVVVKSQVFSHMDKANRAKFLKEKAQQGVNTRCSPNAIYPGCGYVEVMDALVNKVMEPQQVQPLTINVESFIWGYMADVKLRRVKELLEKMSLRVNTFLPAATLEQIRTAPRAQLNIVRRKKWALTMEERFGTDFLHVANMYEWHGLQGIRDFYLEIGKKLDIASQVEQVLDLEEARISRRYQELRAEFSRYKFCLIAGGLDGLPEYLKAYHQDYGMPITQVCLILNPRFQAETGLDAKTMELMEQKIYQCMEQIGCQAEVRINPTQEELQQAAELSDFIICGSNPRYNGLGKPIIPSFIDTPVFDFTSLLELMEDTATKIRMGRVIGSHLLLKRLEYDPLYYPTEDSDENTRASREMYSRMWRLRRK